ncbi:helix-turn-helix domain-containing protein [Streptomyces sp. CA-181903]|uniref:helix-turn-helix domain-containing protein n=1 Tax=Streptomyces sp. CA-181903 TaxID=3240055 RepID=UPI003D900E67
MATVSSSRTRAATGCGAKRFVDDRALLEAEHLLAHTNPPPAVIGERVGFHHATAFNAFFRSRTGTTPTAFRARGAGITLATRHLGGSQPAAGDSPKDSS